ncbi:DUF7674 family protein [Acutalibacter sp. 1XD8-36]|uniref:DUF7674 family protein n=1 Tax=Acutalibacter sp. 1XD8-36 TaxID=2320852 RepID=UPI0026368C71|nr:hypothetical protein [Acutalibacter sp. 1XD8-36]
MDFNAFQLISAALSGELTKQGFSEPAPMEDPQGQAAIFAAEEVAYSLLYDRRHKSFFLRSANLDPDGRPGEWRTLSTWLFDEQTGDRSDAESIINDFLEIIQGPKRVQMVQQQRKRSKGRERTVDPMFFVNRLVHMFPGSKDALNEEKIVYGQVRYITFIKGHLLPEIESLLKSYPDSELVGKLAGLLDDMYKNGDLDLRSIVTYVVIDGLTKESYEVLYERLGDELKKSAKPARRLIGKNIRPEKKKKQRGKKVEARLS